MGGNAARAAADSAGSALGADASVGASAVSGGGGWVAGVLPGVGFALAAGEGGGGGAGGVFARMGNTGAGADADAGEGGGEGEGEGEGRVSVEVAGNAAGAGVSAVGGTAALLSVEPPGAATGSTGMISAAGLCQLCQPKATAPTTKTAAVSMTQKRRLAHDGRGFALPGMLVVPPGADRAWVRCSPRSASARFRASRM